MGEEMEVEPLRFLARLNPTESRHPLPRTRTAGEAPSLYAMKTPARCPLPLLLRRHDACPKVENEAVRGFPLFAKCLDFSYILTI